MPQPQQGRKRASNPGYTTLKSVGRRHRNEPFHLVYDLAVYPRANMVDAELLDDWCSVRYLNSRKRKGTRWRIETYRHRNGRRYVHRVMFETLTDDERVELGLKFSSDFMVTKVGEGPPTQIVRDGRLRRPRLNKEEKKARDEWLDTFYADVARRRREAAEAQAALALSA